LLQGISNDYADVYKRLMNNIHTKSELHNDLIALCGKIPVFSGLCMLPTNSSENRKVKILLYMLHAIGYVNDWYSHDSSSGNDKDNVINIMVDVCASDTESYRNDSAKITKRMKKRLRDYFLYLGNDRESVVKVDRANTDEEIISVYVNWYYEKYLYRHIEQFLDMFELIERSASNNASDNERITTEIKDYFVLPFIKLKKDEALFEEMSLKEIINKALVGIGRDTLSNIERINSNRYSVKLDFLLFCSHLRMNGAFERSRLTRVTRNIKEKERQEIHRGLIKLYRICDVGAKLAFLNYLGSTDNVLSMSCDSLLETIYADGEKDIIYYGILAKRINKQFDRRKHYV
jgi:hypothetical protein